MHTYVSLSKYENLHFWGGSTTTQGSRRVVRMPADGHEQLKGNTFADIFLVGVLKFLCL